MRYDAAFLSREPSSSLSFPEKIIPCPAAILRRPQDLNQNLKLPRPKRLIQRAGCGGFKVGRQKKNPSVRWGNLQYPLVFNGSLGGSIIG